MLGLVSGNSISLRTVAPASDRTVSDLRPNRGSPAHTFETHTSLYQDSCMWYRGCMRDNAVIASEPMSMDAAVMVAGIISGG